MLLNPQTPIMLTMEEAELNARPMEVRYGTFSRGVKDQPWRPCVKASVHDDVLEIDHGDHIEWVPLHIVRSAAEYRRRKSEPVKS